MSRLANHRPQRAYQDRPDAAKTRHGAIHLRNPAGSKLLRRMYKHATGMRGSARKALAWYGALQEKFKNMPFPLGDRRNKLPVKES